MKMIQFMNNGIDLESIQNFVLVKNVKFNEDDVKFETITLSIYYKVNTYQHSIELDCSSSNNMEQLKYFIKEVFGVSIETATTILESMLSPENQLQTIK